MSEQQRPMTDAMRVESRTTIQGVDYVVQRKQPAFNELVRCKVVGLAESTPSTLLIVNSSLLLSQGLISILTSKH